MAKKFAYPWLFSMTDCCQVLPMVLVLHRLLNWSNPILNSLQFCLQLYSSLLQLSQYLSLCIDFLLFLNVNPLKK